MPKLIITENGSTPWWTVLHNDNVHIALSGDFGGGSVAFEQLINGASLPILLDKTPVIETSDSDEEYRMKRGDKIRLTTSGATDPAINVSISDNPDTYEAQISNKDFGYYVD